MKKSTAERLGLDQKIIAFICVLYQTRTPKQIATTLREMGYTITHRQIASVAEERLKAR